MEKIAVKALKAHNIAKGLIVTAANWGTTTPDHLENATDGTSSETGAGETTTSGAAWFGDFILDLGSVKLVKVGVIGWLAATSGNATLHLGISKTSATPSQSTIQAASLTEAVGTGRYKSIPEVYVNTRYIFIRGNCTAQCTAQAKLVAITVEEVG